MATNPSDTLNTNNGSLGLDRLDSFYRQDEQAKAVKPAYQPTQSDPTSVSDFTAKVMPQAERVAAKLGVSVDSVIGQWGLETGWGKSVIPVTNNLGNIKDFSGGGVAATDNATGSRDRYKSFDSLDSFADSHADLLSRKYTGAVGAGNDAEKFFTGLKAGGYAEDPNYVQKGTAAAALVAKARAGMQPTQPKPMAVDNAPKWSAVVAKPEYKNMSAEDKAGARQAYFDQFIAPDLQGDQLAQAKSWFDSEAAKIEPKELSLLDKAKATAQKLFTGGTTQPDNPEAIYDPVTGVDLYGGSAPTPKDESLGVMANYTGTNTPEKFDATKVGFAQASKNKMAYDRETARMKQIEQSTGGVGLTNAEGKKFTPLDEEAFYKYNNDPLYSNPVVRSAVKGWEGLKQGAYGVNQAVWDLVGNSEFSKQQGAKGDQSRAKLLSMGDPENYGMRMFEGAVTSIAQQLPALIGGAVTGSEGLVLGSMFTNSFGQEYGQGKASGLNNGDAAMRAGLFGAYEVLGEKAGLKFNMDKIRQATQGMTPDILKGWLANTLTKELPGEFLTTTGQFLTDKTRFGLNKEAGIAEYLQQMADTGVQTIMQAGLMAGGTKAIAKGVEKFNGTGQPITEPLAQPEQAPTAQPAAEAAPITTPVAEATPTAKPAPTADDQYVVDYADSRREMLIAKREGTIVDQLSEDGTTMVSVDKAGKGLSKAEQAELQAIEQAGGDVAKLNEFYGITKETPANVPEPAKVEQEAQAAQGQEVKTPEPVAAPAAESVSAVAAEPTPATVKESLTVETEPAAQVEDPVAKAAAEYGEFAFSTGASRDSTEGLENQFEIDNYKIGWDRAAEKAKQSKPKTEKEAKAQREAKKQQQEGGGLSIGKLPNSAEPITVKDGAIYIGKYPAQDFGTGEDVRVANDATPQQIKDALTKAGAIGRGNKIFGLNNTETVKNEPQATETKQAEAQGQEQQAAIAEPVKAEQAATGVPEATAGSAQPGAVTPAEYWKKATPEQHAEIMRVSKLDSRFANSDYNAMPEDAKRKINYAVEKITGTKPVSKPKTEKERNQQADYSEKWFGSQDKAQAFIEKKRIGDTHEVVKNGAKFEIKAKAAAPVAEVKQVKVSKQTTPRKMTNEGRAVDGGVINGGDTFSTSSGRETTPYPKQKGEKYASQWLIDNAVAEATARGDDFNANMFKGEKANNLPSASVDSMQEYLFGEQPAVVPSILKPLESKAAPADDLNAMFDDVLAEEVAKTKPESTDKNVKQWLSDIGNALAKDLKKKKERLSRLQNEAKAGGITLEEKLSRQTKVKAAEATLRKMRQSIYDAEDAANEAFNTGDISRFSNYADLFDSASSLLNETINKTPAKPNTTEKTAKVDVYPMPSKKPKTEKEAKVARSNIVDDENPSENIEAEDGEHGWREAGSLGAEDGSSIGVSIRDIREPNEVVRQVRLFHKNSETVPSLWQWNASRLPDLLDLKINTAMYQYTISTAQDDAFAGIDLTDGDAVWSVYGDQIMHMLGKIAPSQNKQIENASSKPKTEKEARTTKAAAVSAAKNTAEGFGNAIDGLGALFGGKGTFGSGPVFNEETYAKAKPLFQAAIANFDQAGADIKEVMRAVVKSVLDKFGEAVVNNMKPYIVRFVGEYQQPANLVDHLYNAITAGNMPKDNPALRKLVAEFDKKEVSQERLKQAQEDIEAAIARVARDEVAKGGSDAEIFARLQDLYQSQPNLNIRTSTSVENQAYSTPAPLAFLAARLAGIGQDTKTYEPTAGNGMLLITANPANATANELEGQRFANLKAQGFKALQGDALEADVKAKSQDAVITNPPFGSVKDANGNATKVPVDGYKIGKIDHLIAAKALDAMKDDGKATLIIGADKVTGGLSADDRTFFNWLYSHYNVTGHFEVDGKLYTRQGAGWPVRVIAINGRSKSNNVSPREGTIGRAKTWSEVYESYQNVLDASNTNVGNGEGSIGSGSESSASNELQPISQPTGTKASGTNQGRSGGSTGGNGGQRGTNTGTGGNSGKQSNGSVGSPTGTDRLPAEANQQDQLGKGKPSGGATKPAKGDQSKGNTGDDSVGNEFQTEYVTRSANKDKGVSIPINMRDSTQDALSRLEDEVGDIDQYAAKELGYKSVTALHDALMGLQVDSVASAIYQIKNGKAIVIADQTGIGKGRQAAAVLRWAALNGKIPVFITKTPSLFTDMYEELHNIGHKDTAPFLMNQDASITDENGDKVFRNKSSTHSKTLNNIANSGQLPAGSNMLFLTYSQINTDNVQRRAVLALADKAVFVLDESHNAAGQSGTGKFVIDALQNAQGVTYLSATFAKRPDNIPLYFKTDIGSAIGDSEALMYAMQAGGLPLQTVISNNLVKSGQMFRRERSYDGISITTNTDTENRTVHEKLSDSVTSALRAIVDADRTFHEVYFDAVKEQAEQTGGTALDIAGNQASQSVSHTEFSSVVHNFVRQLLLGLKADTAANRAIETIKEGKKPLIAVENTMGSFLKEYAEANGIQQDGPLGSFDYRTVLERALSRSRHIIKVDEKGNKTKVVVPLKDLDPITRSAYDKAQRVINGLDMDIPVSPIDWIRYRIEKAGYSVAEITGRELSVDYSNPKKPILNRISVDEKKDKVLTTTRFNNGSLDALILNVAGSTGINLHASEKYKDQRPRHMIVAQAAQDINTFMQMLGRIHRTGQVVLPSFEILNADLPAEKRPTALLSKKMKSLNANTSSNTESATSVKAADMMNKYGDQIVAQYLDDNPDMRKALGFQGAQVGEKGDAEDDIARKATGRLALMPVEVQKHVYADLEEQYSTLIEYLNKTNQNDLEPRTFDFDAKELKQDIIFKGDNPNSPFGADAIYNEFSIKAQGSPMTPTEIKDIMNEHLGGKTAVEHSDAIILNMRADNKEYFAKQVEKLKAEGETDINMSEFDDATDPKAREPIAFINSHRIGATFRVEINGDLYNAVVTNIRNVHKGNGSPYAMSKVHVTVAVNGALRSVTVPATQFKRIEVTALGANNADRLFDAVPRNEREKAKIITGNLLSAYGELKGTTGTIINFTREDGSVEQGILLPKKFDFKANTMGDFNLRSGREAFKFLSESNSRDVDKIGISSRDNTVRITPKGDGITIQVPKSKAKGAKYFLEKSILDVTGDFTSSGNFMTVTVPGSKAVKAIDAVMKKSALYVASSMADEAKTILGVVDKPAAGVELNDIPAQNQTDTPAFKKWFGDSKVVDGSGKPMKMFHGTTAEFSEFKQGTGMLGNGIYFTTKPDRAGLYPKMHNIQEKAAGREEKPINVMPVYLRMTNPLTMDELPVGGIDTKKIQAGGYDGVIHGHQYLVFSPNQIKSATGNNGNFDANENSILLDLTKDSILAGGGNDVAKLKSLATRMADGKITPAEYKLGVTQLTSRIASTTLNSTGTANIRASLLAAKQAKIIRSETVDFALWLLDKNPAIAAQLSMSLKDSKKGSPAGSYKSAERLITLFKQSVNNGTAVHEILHHTERMMPPEIQKGIVREWQKAWVAEWEKGDANVKAAMSNMLASSMGDKDAFGKMVKSFADGTLNYDTHYELSNPSEYWAVNATRLLSSEYAAKNGWSAKAKQFIKDLIAYVKKAFGVTEKDPIVKALNAVLNGNGKEVTDRVLAELTADTMAGNELNDLLNQRETTERTQQDLIKEFGKPTFSNIDWWDKSVGTMYNTAAKNPEFKKVFDLLLARENTTSLTAVRAAEEAPGFLPRVDDFKSAVKTAIMGKKASRQHDLAAQAILEGTLAGDSVLDGKVWSVEELKAKGLDEQGIALYGQARSAINASLNEVAAAEGYAALQMFIPRAMRAAVMDNPRDAVDMLRAAIDKRIAMDEKRLQAMKNKGATDEAMAELEQDIADAKDALNTMEQIFAYADLLKAAGYAPLMRFGKYFVSVEEVDPITGKTVVNDKGEPNTLFFSRYETEGEAQEAYFRMKVLHGNDRSLNVDTGKVNDEKYKMYAGMSPETMSLFAGLFGKKEVERKIYQQVVSERSALKRRLERNAIAGYSQDLPRILANFITSNGRYAASLYYTRDINSAIKYIPRNKGDVQKEAQDLKAYLDNPKDAGAAWSGLAFAWFMGGNIASAAINATQPVMMSFPYLSQWGAGKASAALTKATPYAMGKKQITDPQLRHDLKRASQEGKVDAQEIFHLYTVGIQGVAGALTGKMSKLPLIGKHVKGASESGRARMNAVLTLWGMPFAMVEGFNRRLTFIAAWNMAKAQGESDPYAFATRAVDETQGIYNKVNRPKWARSTAGRTIMTFTQFRIMNAELIKRMATRGGPEGKRAAALYLAVLILAAGVAGLPYADDIDDIIDTVGQFYGYDTNMKRNKREWAHKTLGKFYGDLALYGMSSQLPLDFGGRMGLGNMVPSTGFLKPSNFGSMNMVREGMEVFGPVGAGLGGKALDSVEEVGMGNYGKALAGILPSSMSNAAAGLDMMATGKAKDLKGREKIDVTPLDGAIKAVGFNPTTVANVSRKNMPIQQDLALQKKVEANIVEIWAQGAAQEDQAMMDKANAMMEEWNSKNPDTPVAISAKQIQSKAKTLNMPADTRLFKGAPREMRGRVSAGLSDD